MIAGLAGSLPHTLTAACSSTASRPRSPSSIGNLPPVASLFAAFLGVNPVQHLLGSAGALSPLSQANQQALTGNAFFPHLISAPFHQGLVVVFSMAAALAVLAAAASLLRGARVVAPRRPSPAVRASLTEP